MAVQHFCRRHVDTAFVQRAAFMLVKLPETISVMVMCMKCKNVGSKQMYNYFLNKVNDVML